MKKIYNFLSIMAMLVFAALYANAQGTRIVTVEGWPPPYEGNSEDFNNLLYDAIEADTTERKTNPNVIFVLKRDHKYPTGKVIKNYGYHLHLRAEEGTGLLPEITPGKNAAGSYSNTYIESYDDLTLQNIAFNCYRPDGAYKNRSVTTWGKKSRYVVEGCLFDGDRGSGIVIRADSMKVYVKDVVVGNTGHRYTVGGNGRLLDFRNECLYVDTLIITNSTVNNATDRVVRNMNTVVNYFELDHVTALNNEGYHGGVQLGKVRTAKVTNCLFANTISLGHNEARTNEQTQPELHLAVITLDTVFDGQVIEIRNNNIYHDQVIQDVWAKYDTVEAPWPITPTIETALGDAKDDAYFVEPLTFTKSCDPISAYVDAFYATPTAEKFPENWCVGGQGGYFLDEMDLSYSTESVSYKAADKGYPVGNLNYFPELKTKWENGEDLTAVGIGKEPMESRYSLRNYPNPFSGATTIAYELKSASAVSLEVFDITGRMVRGLLREIQQAGSYEVAFDASGLPGGVYFYKLDTGSGVSVRNMLLTK